MDFADEPGEDDSECALIDTQQSSTWQGVPGDKHSVYEFSWRVQVADWSGTSALRIVWPQAVEIKQIFGADLVAGAKGTSTLVALGLNIEDLERLWGSCPSRSRSRRRCWARSPWS